MTSDEGTINAVAFADGKIKEAKEGRSASKEPRRSILNYLETYRGFTEEHAKTPTIDENVEIGDFNATHRRFEGIPSRGSAYTIDVWSFRLAHADVHLIYTASGEPSRRWGTTVARSAKSFKLIERVEPLTVDSSTRTFKDQMAWAKQEAAKVEGWYAIGTPSERFVILTNAEKRAFVQEVIKRLEVSRDVFERDFPPPPEFRAVSIIRICRDAQEFRRFSGARAGVAGYFSPSTVELVLYDNVNVDRNSTYAVVTHEAFHQYCHFLFGQSEAHRWFDEGHGDYYGGMKIKGSRGNITPKMPSGLNRLSIAREMVRNETYKPIQEHINYTHREWQTQGPSGVSPYAQSWSIIYMLRQGALRKVSAKCWEKEYAEIIPNYVRVLNEGFQAAYEEIRQKRIAIAEEDEVELSPKDLEVTRRDLDEPKKQEIWKAAMEASWGKVDLEEFQENWALYVKKHLK